MGTLNLTCFIVLVMLYEQGCKFNAFFFSSSDELSFQEKISSTLREILVSEKDLDEVTSKEIRTKLEHKLKTDLSK